ncbi:hypothetical protein HHI36_010256 [Cryptolaemus montrouzieri]|uniref:Serine/threonine-protein phosphatase 4 regulatory subunit 2 n=1 Tax=Cryptolaemus montrouzieri TaxID=559131 RepID=A0ABD2MI70_9CUCU
MENPEEILHSLEEFSKFRPKDIPRELEEYLCFVAKTGDPVYQWSSIKHLFKEKLISVVNEFYEACPLIDIPPCPNVEIFNYDTMKSFILEKLETFAAAPFTVQRICELLTTPRKEYNRIDKFMRALEKNILVVSTIEPGCKNAENGESIVNGLESEHLPESSNCSSEINVVEMEESPVWQRNEPTEMQFQTTEDVSTPEVQDAFIPEVKETDKDSACSSSQDNVIINEENDKEFVPIEDVPINSSVEESTENMVSAEINVDALPPQVEEENNTEPVASSEILYEVTASDAVSSADVRESDIVEGEPKTEETAIQESLKLADSTTSSKSPETESLPSVSALDGCPVEVKQPSEAQEIQDPLCEIASSENVGTDSDSNQSLASVEPDTAASGVPLNDTETDSNEAKEMSNTESEESIGYGEDSNSSPADTTKGYEGQLENNFRNDTEENKDEEITSSDKVVVAVPNTSIDDISDDESEAEADVQREALDVDKEQGDVSTAPATSEIDSQVTASTDNLNKDCEETPMEVDLKEKSDFNEAEATCESI